MILSCCHVRDNGSKIKLLSVIFTLYCEYEKTIQKIHRSGPAGLRDRADAARRKSHDRSASSGRKLRLPRQPAVAIRAVHQSDLLGSRDQHLLRSLEKHPVSEHVSVSESEALKAATLSSGFFIDSRSLVESNCVGCSAASCRCSDRTKGERIFVLSPAAA